MPEDDEHLPEDDQQAPTDTPQANRDEAQAQPGRRNPEWKWGDEPGAPEEPEPASWFSDDEERILAEAELLLQSGKTVEEITELLRGPTREC